MNGSGVKKLPCLLSPQVFQVLPLSRSDCKKPTLVSPPRPLSSSLTPEDSQRLEAAEILYRNTKAEQLRSFESLEKTVDAWLRRRSPP
ncbi:hypothetical protein NIES4072_23740 [Nostoc commune NIES-4072]|uniref:Uncharacterized protein n=1 Tax=Nostoc commune NIES-4072 TaxID=2005467 RepID=A0A2R5FL15_NOSCO|nr:hypothetical protein NIES4072_23740 [Nostoc commune NIES-4072]